MGRRNRKIVEFTDPQVPFSLTEAEQRTKAFELAQLCGEIDKARADAAADAGTARKQIRALALKQRLLADCVRTGTEMRNAQEKLFRDEPAAPAPAPAPTPTEVAAAAFGAPTQARPPCGMCSHAEHASFPGRACGAEMVGGHFCVCGLDPRATAAEPDAPPAAAKAPLVPSSADFASPFDDETDDDFAARPGTTDGYVGERLAAPSRGRGSKAASKGTNGTAK